MVQNVSSSEVIGIVLDLFSKGFVFLLPIIGVLAGIHLIYSMIMNVLFRDRLGENMQDVYYYTPLHNKFVKFDDITWLIIIMLTILALYFIKNMKVRPKR